MNIVSFVPSSSKPLAGKVLDLRLMQETSRVRTALTLLFVAVAYYFVAKLAFLGAYADKESMILWLPAGIALTALLLCGYRAWPAIFVGAFLSHPVLRVSLFASLAIGAGSTLAALFGAWALHRFFAFDNSLKRLQDVLGLAAFPVVIGSMINAIIGVTSLCMWHIRPWAMFGALLRDWWLGSVGGYLVVAPLLLVWISGPRASLHGRVLVELLLLTASTLLASVAIFGPWPLEEVSGKFILFPFVIWGAYRFGQQGTTVTTSVIAAMAIWWLSYGTGAQGVSVEDPLTFQIFLITLATTGLFLGSAINERNIAEESVREAKTAAEKANRTKDIFLATLSHELRTPLTAISGWAQLLKAGRLDPAKTKIGLQAIEDGVISQNQLISDLLDISRISAGKISLEIQNTELTGIVGKALDMVRMAAEEKSIHIIEQLEPMPMFVSGDAGRLKQIVWNLLTNAIKFTRPGGSVEVMLGTCEDTSGRRAQIRIRDTGKGIPAEFLPHIFEQFSQADSSSVRVHGGLGLGLALVHSLAKLQGGTVEAQSEGEGKGATFTVTLPLASASRFAGAAYEALPRTPAAGEKLSDRPVLSGIRVLLVDDEENARHVLREILSSLGAQVSLASSAPEAIAEFERSTPDVIISDIAMPLEEGLDQVFARHLER